MHSTVIDFGKVLVVIGMLITFDLVPWGGGAGGSA